MNENTNFSTFQWKIGLKFPNRDAFKKAIAKFVITNGINLSYIVGNKNMQQRLGIKCLTGCVTPPTRHPVSSESVTFFFLL